MVCPGRSGDPTDLSENYGTFADGAVALAWRLARRVRALGALAYLHIAYLYARPKPLWYGMACHATGNTRCLIRVVACCFQATSSARMWRRCHCSRAVGAFPAFLHHPFVSPLHQPPRLLPAGQSSFFSPPGLPMPTTPNHHCEKVSSSHNHYFLHNTRILRPGRVGYKWKY